LRAPIALVLHHLQLIAASSPTLHPSSVVWGSLKYSSSKVPSAIAASTIQKQARHSHRKAFFTTAAMLPNEFFPSYSMNCLLVNRAPTTLPAQIKD
jgi:hypothetical protein